MSTFLNPDAILDNSITAQKLSEELINKISGGSIVNSIDELDINAPVGSITSVVSTGGNNEISISTLKQTTQNNVSEWLDQTNNKFIVSGLSMVDDVNITIPENKVAYNKDGLSIRFVSEDSSTWGGGTCCLMLGWLVTDGYITSLIYLNAVEGQEENIITLAEYTDNGVTVNQDGINTFKSYFTQHDLYSVQLAEFEITNTDYDVIDMFIKAIAPSKPTADIYIKRDTWVKNAVKVKLNDDVVEDKNGIIDLSSSIKTVNYESVFGSGNVNIAVDNTCKIYYSGVIDESTLPTDWGNGARVIANRPVADYFDNSVTSEDYFKCLIFNKPVLTIPYRAFMGCDIYSIMIPASVNEIGNEAFIGNNQLFFVDARYYTGRITSNTMYGANKNIIISGNKNICTDLTNCNAFYAKNLINYPVFSYTNTLIPIETTKTVNNGDNLLTIDGFIVKYETALPDSGAVNILRCNNGGIVFTTGSQVCAITVVGGYKWANGTEPTFEANKTYEIRIFDGRAICISY